MKFQPSPHSYGAVDAAPVESPEEEEATLLDVLAEQASKLKDDLTQELHLRRLIVTMVGGAVVTVGTGVVVAWLTDRLRRRREEEAALLEAEAGPPVPSVPPIEFLCIPKPQA